VPTRPEESGRNGSTGWEYGTRGRRARDLGIEASPMMMVIIVR